MICCPGPIPPRKPSKTWPENSAYNKYGYLEKETWQDDLRKGFAECFRVLKPDGVLVFKWNECHIPLKEILPLAPKPPLFGQRGGRSYKTHFIVFIK